jgi:hypothetical protein
MPDIALSILSGAVLAFAIHVLVASIGMIVALRDDPEISEMIIQGRFLDLLQDQRIIDAANDSILREQIKKFDLQRALDYSISGR